MMTAAGADIIADKAVTIATRPRPGPVHIDIPISVAEGSVKIDRLRRLVHAAPAGPAQDAALAQGRAWLAEAKRPLVIAGLDVTNHRAEGALKRFVETYRTPFITTYKAKGVIPEDHPLCLGGAGLSPLADKHLLQLVGASDLLICAGYDPIEMRVGWREAWDPAKQRVIDIATVPNTHYVHQAGLNFVGDVGAGLDALSAGVAPAAAWPEATLAKVRAGLAETFPTEEAWGPAAVIDEARKRLPADAIATVDSGAHRILLSQMWKSFEPRALLQSTGLCTMGCALPLAAGAKLADPARPVVAFAGDAGFLMVAGELSTLAELGLPVILIVFVDASLALIELKQRGRQLANVGVDFGQHDVGAIGRAFGGNGYTCHSRAELAAAIKAGLAADRFTVIGCVIDRRAYDGRL